MKEKKIIIYLLFSSTAIGPTIPPHSTSMRVKSSADCSYALPRPYTADITLRCCMLVGSRAPDWFFKGLGLTNIWMSRVLLPPKPTFTKKQTRDNIFQNRHYDKHFKTNALCVFLYLSPIIFHIWSLIFVCPSPTAKFGTNIYMIMDQCLE